MQTIKRALLGTLLFLLAGCTTTDKERVPGAELMHFPYSMVLKGHHLMVSSQSSDHKYSFGRLVAIDTNAVDRALVHGAAKNPIPYSDVVTANTLIARDVGLLSSNDYIVFASRESDSLYAVLGDDKGFRCKDPMKELKDCADVRVLKLEGKEPFSLETISTSSQGEKIIVSYLSSDRLDVVDLNPQNKALSVEKTVFVKDIIRDKEGAKASDGYRFVTRKVHGMHRDDPAKAKLYFLLEKYKEKHSALLNSEGAYLLSVSAQDFFASSPSFKSFELWNLTELYNVSAASDIFINEKLSMAYLLAREPESLYKISLSDKKHFENELVCSGAASLAASLKYDRIFVPCFKDNKIISFGMSLLHLEGAAGFHGRGPAYIAVDDDHKKIFVSYNLDGTVGIFDFDLAYVGHIFNEAPKNSMGS